MTWSTLSWASSFRWCPLIRNWFPFVIFFICICLKVRMKICFNPIRPHELLSQMTCQMETDENDNICKEGRVHYKKQITINENEMRFAKFVHHVKFVHFVLSPFGKCLLNKAFNVWLNRTNSNSLLCVSKLKGFVLSI